MPSHLLRSTSIAVPWGASTMSNVVTEKPSSDLPRKLYGYDVIDFLGEGAGSVIYAVSDPVTSQVYALKQVVVKTEKDQRFVDQLVNEYEIGSKVRHPMLRRCIDLKVNKTLLRKTTDAALIMEMFDGVSCEFRPPSDINAAIDIFRQTADALHALNAQGFVHCDLKPNNIMVSSDGAVKVIDLGQACPIGSVKKRIQGTPDFISPEQVRCEPVTIQTDVYNLGATMYWILSGQKLPTLFTLKKGENSFLVADAIPQPHEINPAVPQNLSNLVMECCRTTAAKRPADMAELSRRLDIIQLTLSGGSQQAAVSAQ
jgi:serine/threonine-protein kinase